MTAIWRAVPYEVTAGEDGFRYVEHGRADDLSVGTYALADGIEDPQGPHTADEVYVVVSGEAVLETPQGRFDAGPGDVLFVAAGEEHRFTKVRGDFRAVVVFGPAGDSEA
ncbi:MAG TPA: cupin domain-containing protein [Mycobacteriales bacterium]|nr:cupin domain-containing protein [Mycobacteriales bacterium]